MTTAEYLATPETVKPQELAYGVLRAADSPLPIHQQAVADLFRALDAHVRGGGLGRVWLAPLDVILDHDAALVVQPDLFFIANDRAEIVTDRVRGAPDLVVEVLSPHPRVGVLTERLEWFAHYGVRECWLFHQFERRLEILHFDDGRVTDRQTFQANDSVRSTVLPNFHESLDAMLTWW
jgi:Uma2 family endonuclease